MEEVAWWYFLYCYTAQGNFQKIVCANIDTWLFGFQWQKVRCNPENKHFEVDNKVTGAKSKGLRLVLLFLIFF